MKKMIFAVAVAALFAACCSKPKEAETTLSGLKASNFQKEVNGKMTDLYVLTNGGGAEVCLTNYGGRIVSVMVPDKDGKMVDVVLGFDNIEDYLNIDNNFGATIGRYGNRIGHGRFTLDGVEYNLTKNNNGNTLHGGTKGWDKMVFDAEQTGPSSVVFTVNSPDGESGFPGNVNATITMTLTENNAIKIEYAATSDKKTILNLTNHSYFNLAGDTNISAVDQILYINADYYTPTDSLLITTGETRPVAGTPMDFTQPKFISRDIDADYESLRFGNGYDHNWVLNTKGDLSQLACRLVSPVTGIAMEVYTNEPGVQLYTGNFLDGTITGKNGMVYGFRSAVCLETQHYPDTPNKPEWPSVTVDAGQQYGSVCVYKFSVEK